MKLFIILLFVSFQAFDQKNIILDVDSSDVFKTYFNENLKNDLNKSFEKSPDNIILNSFIAKYGIEFDINIKYKELLNTNVDAWEMSLFDKRTEQIAFLKSKKDSLTTSNYKFLENEVLYNYWHLLLAYPVIRSNLDQKIKRLVSLPKIMTKSLKIENFNNDSLLESKSFRRLLPFLITYKNSEQRDFVKYSDMIQSTSDKADFTTKNLKNAVSDYALATILSSNPDRVSSGITRYIISQINNEQIQNSYKGEFLSKVIDKETIALAKIKEDQKKKKDAKDLKDRIQLTDLNEKTFDFSKYIGKVVYVDFWASWCGPCRKEFPYSKKMHEELSEKDKKNIVFLYISIDDIVESWKNAVKSMGLDSFENGFSPGGWSSEVVKKYKITGIPRYMIIDKKGNIVKPDASRPSNPDTISELLELSK